MPKTPDFSASWEWLRGRKARWINSTLYVELRPGERGHGGPDATGEPDNTCGCRYCSADGIASDRYNEDGVWDTLGIAIEDGRVVVWRLHMPELHGRKPRRASDRNPSRDEVTP